MLYEIHKLQRKAKLKLIHLNKHISRLVLQNGLFFTNKTKFEVYVNQQDYVSCIQILGTLRKLDGNATTAAINTMKFIILNKRDE